jgi:hypothetical protein
MMNKPHRMTDLANRPVCAMTLIDRRQGWAPQPGHLALQGRHRIRPSGAHNAAHHVSHSAVPAAL